MVKVGYFIYMPMKTESDYIWFNANGLMPVKITDNVSKVAMVCPALHSIFDNTWAVLSPFDMHFSCKIDDNKNVFVTVHSETTFKQNRFDELFVLSPINERSDPNKPLIQMPFPLIFVSDDDVELELLPPLLFHKKNNPIRTAAGKWNIKDWTRNINWVFEWQELDTDLIIKRGEPLFYIKFYPKNRDDKVNVVKLEITKKLKDMSDEAASVKLTFSHDYASIMKHVGQQRKRVFRKYKFW